MPVLHAPDAERRMKAIIQRYHLIHFRFVRAAEWCTHREHINCAGASGSPVCVTKRLQQNENKQNAPHPRPVHKTFSRFFNKQFIMVVGYMWMRRRPAGAQKRRAERMRGKIVCLKPPRPSTHHSHNVNAQWMMMKPGGAPV